MNERMCRVAGAVTRRALLQSGAGAAIASSGPMHPATMKIHHMQNKWDQMIKLKLSNLVALAALVATSSGPFFVQAKAQDVDRTPQTILYGVSYYDEYTPVDRVDEDFRLMKEVNITVVRIAESTWGTLEPQPGVFDFSHVDRMLSAAQRYGIKVIVGTPTYAIPTWLARQHPDVLVTRPEGQAKFGVRQNMDITNPHYRAAAQRVIEALIAHVAKHPAVIGYQVDNETKPYNTAGPNVQAAFVKALQQKWGSLDAFEQGLGPRLLEQSR